MIWFLKSVGSSSSFTRFEVVLFGMSAAFWPPAGAKGLAMFPPIVGAAEGLFPELLFITDFAGASWLKPGANGFDHWPGFYGIPELEVEEIYASFFELD